MLRENGTEKPFTGEYNSHYEKGRVWESDLLNRRARLVNLSLFI